jgi:predicted alpha/beta superfamily hydrolase
MASWLDYPYPPEAAAHPLHPRLQVLPDLWSPELGNARDILVALPASYDAPAERPRRYPVVYMHDGQNLFDPATSFAGHWRLGDTLAYHALEGIEAIVVGIPNVGRRRAYEYSPFRDREHGGGDGEDYMAFLVETLKPRIDADLRTLPGREHTVVAGSSLGGLISLYAILRHPDVFAAAGALSPALWFADRAIFDYAAGRPGARGRIHLDVGLEEGDEAVADVRRMRDLLVARGWSRRRDLSYVEEAHAEHREDAWARRLRAALPFLLGRDRPSGVAALFLDEPDDGRAAGAPDVAP